MSRYTDTPSRISWCFSTCWIEAMFLDPSIDGSTERFVLREAFIQAFFAANAMVPVSPKHHAKQGHFLHLMHTFQNQCKIIKRVAFQTYLLQLSISLDATLRSLVCGCCRGTLMSSSCGHAADKSWHHTLKTVESWLFSVEIRQLSTLCPCPECVVVVGMRWYQWSVAGISCRQLSSLRLCHAMPVCHDYSSLNLLFLLDSFRKLSWATAQCRSETAPVVQVQDDGWSMVN